MIDTDSLNVLLFYSCTASCIPFIAFFLYVIVKKSTSSMVMYRNTLMNMMVWYSLAIVSIGLLMQPIYAEFDSKQCAKFYGLGTMLFGLVGGYVTAILSIITVLNAGTSIVLCIFYRYIALRWTHLSINTKSLHAFLFILLTHALCTAFILLIVLLFLSFAEIISVDQFYYLCVQQADHHYIILLGGAVVAYILTHCLLGLILFFLTVTVLVRNKSKMSKRTFRLQRILTLNVIIVVALPILFDVIPLAVCVMYILLQLDGIYGIFSIAAHLPFFEVLLVCSATIGFVTPYREAVLIIFRKKKMSLLKVQRLYSR